MKVLIADDHEAVRKGVCAILTSRKDIEICWEAENGKEAVDKAFAHRPDLIILDITMPVFSGFEAAGKMAASSDGRNSETISPTGRIGLPQPPTGTESGFQSVRRWKR